MPGASICPATFKIFSFNPLFKNPRSLQFFFTLSHVKPKNISHQPPQDTPATRIEILSFMRHCQPPHEEKATISPRKGNRCIGERNCSTSSPPLELSLLNGIEMPKSTPVHNKNAGISPVLSTVFL